MAKAKRSTKKIEPAKPFTLKETKAAAAKVRSALSELDLSIVELRSALAAQKGLHYNDGPHNLGDALDWAMSGAYGAIEEVDKRHTEMWAKLREMLIGLGMVYQPEKAPKAPTQNRV